MNLKQFRLSEEIQALGESPAPVLLDGDIRCSGTVNRILTKTISDSIITDKEEHCDKRLALSLGN